jgi:hypothetical protein
VAGGVGGVRLDAGELRRAELDRDSRDGAGLVLDRAFDGPRGRALGEQAGDHQKAQDEQADDPHVAMFHKVDSSFVSFSKGLG